MSILVEYNEALTKDFIADGTITLWQPRQGYRVGIDSVLLAASTKIKPKSHVLDLGCGVGAIALCLLNREPSISVLGLENNSNLVTLANQNASENNFSDQFKIITGSALCLPKDISVGKFDLVISNPPYMPAGTSIPSPNPDKKAAHIEDESGLKKWIETAARALKSKGFLSMIHRADRLSDLLINLEGKFGEITIHPLWPKVGLSAKRVILKARKDSSTPLRLQAGTIIHELDGTYTPLVDAALKGAILNTG